MKNSVFTIVGSGFGLYGYLPAIINTSQGAVVLVERYRKAIEIRPELRCYLDRIEWRETYRDAMDSVDSIVIAVPSVKQREFVQMALSFPKIQNLIIEKPVCPSPGDSIELIDLIKLRSVSLRIGYTFMYTDWYYDLKLALQKPIEKISIYWSFKAHHFINEIETWKRYHSMGGGVIRFYGIHIIAIMASLGYVGVTRQHFKINDFDQPEELKVQFHGLNLPLCDVSISSNSNKEFFQVQISEYGKISETIINSTSPFIGDQPVEGKDNRIPILERLIDSLNNDDDFYMKVYRATNGLWESVEDKLIGDSNFLYSCDT